MKSKFLLISFLTLALSSVSAYNGDLLFPQGGCPESDEISETPQGEDIFVYWRLGENDAFETFGNIAAIPEAMSNMELDRYTSPNAAAVWPEHTGWDASRKTQRVRIAGGAWPGEQTYVSDRYVQFGITAQEGTKILIDSIVMYVCGCGTNGMQCNILYSEDEKFTNPVMIGDFSEKGAMPNSNLKEVIGTPNCELTANKSLYVRVYPWSRGSMNNKTICISDVKISGILLEGSTSINKINDDNKTSQTYYSVTGTRLLKPRHGITIVKGAKGKAKKVIVR